MSGTSHWTRREFIVGSLAAGVAIASFEDVQGDTVSSTPLPTQGIVQPDNAMCFWAGFSPINDQVAFVSGTFDNMKLYVSQVGQPQIFDIIWQPSTTMACIKACAWSPNGKEIAFLVQAVNNMTTPKSAKISIYIADIISRAIREPIIIGESIDGNNRQLVNVSYKKGLSWWENSFVAVPGNDRGVLKLDTHTGEFCTLIPPQNDAVVSNIALTPSGKLHFIKAQGFVQGLNGQFILCSLLPDGTICEDINFTEQLGQILSARLSQDGNFVFAEKGGVQPSDPSIHIIYNIETNSIVGRVPRMVQHLKDMYTYIPLTVRNGNELILIEGVMLAVDGNNSIVNSVTKITKLNLL